MFIPYESWHFLIIRYITSNHITYDAIRFTWPVWESQISFLIWFYTNIFICWQFIILKRKKHLANHINDEGERIIQTFGIYICCYIIIHLKWKLQLFPSCYVWYAWPYRSVQDLCWPDCIRRGCPNSQLRSQLWRWLWAGES